MGHAITHLSFPYEMDRKKIMAEVEEWAANNCDRQENPGGNYNNRFIWEENRIFNNREEADEYLEKKPAYSDGAVLYYDMRDIKEPSSLKKVKEQIEKLKQQAKKYLEDHRVQNQKAEYIGCKNCGSKIKKDKVGNDWWLREKIEFEKNGTEMKVMCKDQKCPVCKHDIRAEYLIAKEKEYSQKITDLLKKQKTLEEELCKKNQKKAKKKWLCKVEVHC